MNNKCEICEQSATLMGGVKDFELYISEQNLILDYNGFHKETIVNYCPVCGRSLSERKVML